MGANRRSEISSLGPWYTDMYDETGLGRLAERITAFLADFRLVVSEYNTVYPEGIKTIFDQLERPAHVAYEVGSNQPVLLIPVKDWIRVPTVAVGLTDQANRPVIGIIQDILTVSYPYVFGVRQLARHHFSIARLRANG